MKQCPLCNSYPDHDTSFAWCKNHECDIFDTIIDLGVWEGTVPPVERVIKNSRFNPTFDRQDYEMED